MDFGSTVSLICAAVFLLLPVIPGWKFSRKGIQESDLRTTCPRCGTTITYGTTQCPHCRKNISTSDVVMRSGYLKNGFKTKRMRFLVGYLGGMLLELVIVVAILKLFRVV